MEFAAATLIGLEDTGQTCINGLPLAPSPTRMLSRFWKIAELKHNNLCQYLELTRCQTATNGVIVIIEHYPRKFIDELRQRKDLDTKFAYGVAIQLCAAINYCHNNRVIIGLLTSENVLLECVNKFFFVKLTQYGFYHISGENNDVDYVIGSAWYLAPERLIPLKDEKNCVGSATFKSDIWSFGIILLETLTQVLLSDIWGIKQILSVLSQVIKKAKMQSALIPLLDAMQFACPNLKILIPKDMLDIIESCLQIFPSKRPSSSSLLKLLVKIKGDCDDALKSKNLTSGLSETIEEIKTRIENENVLNPYLNRSLKELFFLWKLCGSNVESILISKGIIRMKPPVCTIPCLVIDDIQMFGNEDARKVITTFGLYVLPSENLKKRLNSIHLRDYCQSIELEKELTRLSITDNDLDCHSFNDVNSQTLVVKERNIDYQVFRMSLFSKLLAAYPFNDNILRAEAKKDIPPLYRAAVWSALLNVFEDEAYDEFCFLDIFSEHVSDRQLQVDIPRCHQYEELMTTPVAHYKLKILLKAWLISSAQNGSGYVYWQGLDSLAAPFLVLHFNNISSAFRCLSQFINRFLHNFFLKDNSETIQEYLAVFMLLVEFIDPDLAAHLQALDFPPQLFAIPWFLTCFAHVLPLHKLFHLWDALLLADASFPLFIGVAILTQLRPQLINAQFNDAILLFSDLPDLSIDSVVTNSNNFYNSVPASCTHSEHAARHCIQNLKILLIQLLNASLSTTPAVIEGSVF